MFATYFVAFLVKSERRDRLVQARAGVGLAGATPHPAPALAPQQ